MWMYICVCVCVCLCGLCVLSHPSHVRLCNPMDCSLLGSSVHVILPGRKLEWVAMPSSRGSDQGIKPASPALQENSLLLSHGETKYIHQFSSVQFSLSLVSDSLQPQESQHARPPCPSPSPGVHSDSCPSSQWCHPAISYIYIYTHTHFFSFHFFLTLQCKLRGLEKQVRLRPESSLESKPTNVTLQLQVSIAGLADSKDGLGKGIEQGLEEGFWGPAQCGCYMHGIGEAGT